MCTSPIKIYNRSRRFRKGIDKPLLIVPCGHCEECQRKKQNDWSFRAVSEYNRVRSGGGFVWFPTLTYNDGALPMWRDAENGYNIPTFDASHFVAFRNKLRIYLKRSGFDFTGDNTIRFFYACEYGGQYGRPHLHCLLFVPKFVPYNLFRKLVEKAWIYGFVMYSKKGMSIKSPKGIKYVMKYVHKDCYYYDKYKVDDYLMKLKDLEEKDSDIIMKDIHHNKLLAFKKRLPHHHQSMGFGSDFIISDEEYINNKVSSSRLGLYDIEGKSFSYSIPMYYKRKFLYDFDKIDNIYNINPRGLHIKKEMFKNMIDKLEMYYQSVIYSNVVEDLCKASAPYLLNHPLYMFFQRLQRYDTHDLAIYSMIYEGLPLFKNQYLVMSENCKSSPPDFLKQMDKEAFRYWCKRINNLKEPLIDDYKNNGSVDCIKLTGFNDLPVYRNFCLGLYFLQLFEHEIGKKENDAALKAYYEQDIQFGKLFGKTIL